VADLARCNISQSKSFGAVSAGDIIIYLYVEDISYNSVSLNDLQAKMLVPAVIVYKDVDG